MTANTPKEPLDVTQRIEHAQPIDNTLPCCWRSQRALPHNKKPTTKTPTTKTKTKSADQLGTHATANLPSEEDVNAFLHQTFGYDPQLTWKIAGIRPSQG